MNLKLKIKMNSTPKRKNISIEEKYEIIQDKQKGMSTKEIAEKYGHSASTISTITNPANSKKVIDALQAGFGHYLQDNSWRSWICK